jgi:hypothetical protein
VATLQYGRKEFLLRSCGSINLSLFVLLSLSSLQFHPSITERAELERRLPILIGNL